MERLKAYLSRQEDLGNVFILGNGQDIEKLAFYLKHELRVKKVSVIDGIGKGTPGGLLEAKQTDTILFDCGQASAVAALKAVRVRYLIGRMYAQEDYFCLWERYRERAEHIYFVRERSGMQERDGGKRQKGRGASRYEALTWDRTSSPIELSVIVPVYNVRAYLGKCLESLSAWRAAYVEYLVVDDGSTDGSIEIMEEYAREDKRFRLIRKENGGCASARNCGLREAAGRYVGFVDGDDFVDGQMFYKLLSRAIMGNYELAYCGYQEYDEESGTVRRVRENCMREPFLTGTYRPDQVQRLMIQTRVGIWRCIYKKAFLEEHGIVFHEELKRFDDLPFKIESGFRAKSAVCVPEYLYCYRLGRAGQDVACRDEGLFVHFEIFRLLDAAVRPRKSRRLTDYLQIVKLHTHGFALSRIDRKYYAEYLRRARRQMDETAGTVRTILLMLAYGGRKNIGWYLKSGKTG